MTEKTRLSKKQVSKPYGTGQRVVRDRGLYLQPKSQPKSHLLLCKLCVIIC